jgi:hypothetical protein
MDNRRIVMNKVFNHCCTILSTIIEEIEDIMKQRRKLWVRVFAQGRESLRFSKTSERTCG